MVLNWYEKNVWNKFFLKVKIIDFLYFQSSYFVEEDGKEYIYKEPKVTSLAEICERLKNMYSEKYGKDTVKLIMDSNKVLKPGLHVCILYIYYIASRLGLICQIKKCRC